MENKEEQNELPEQNSMLDEDSFNSDIDTVNGFSTPQADPSAGVAPPDECKRWADGPFLDTEMSKCGLTNDNRCYDNISTLHKKLIKACQNQNVPIVCPSSSYKSKKFTLFLFFPFLLCFPSILKIISTISLHLLCVDITVMCNGSNAAKAVQKAIIHAKRTVKRTWICVHRAARANYLFCIVFLSFHSLQEEKEKEP